MMNKIKQGVRSRYSVSAHPVFVYDKIMSAAGGRVYAEINLLFVYYSFVIRLLPVISAGWSSFIR